MKRRVVKGSSYEARVREVNEIYDSYLRSGIPNREILRRYIWPKYKISERTLYNYLNIGLELRREEAEFRKNIKQDRE